MKSEENKQMADSGMDMSKHSKWAEDDLCRLVNGLIRTLMDEIYHCAVVSSLRQV